MSDSADSESVSSMRWSIRSGCCCASSSGFEIGQGLVVQSAPVGEPATIAQAAEASFDVVGRPLPAQFGSCREGLAGAIEIADAKLGAGQFFVQGGTLQRRFGRSGRRQPMQGIRNNVAARAGSPSCW